MNRINIAIDGPSGAGKSTLAKAVSKALHIFYLDTGSMYRAVAYAAVKAGIDIKNTYEVEQLIEKIDLHTVYVDGEQQNLLDGENVMPYIRTPEISKAASDISAYPCVRHKLVAMQREVAEKYDVVLDGRDIGTYVLPNAEYKYYVTADAGERARRRHLELAHKGIDKDYDDVLREMKIRDNNDSTRSFAPLRQADDAILIDTTHMSIDEVVGAVLSRLSQE
ncbi:MAG: (d)CMP kinase [Eubacteriales bacterium]|nr:(d)CMP kinase [Eubacteriales bacterium]